MSAISQERLLQVLLAPQISEKATFVADKNEQVVFKVAADATKPEVKAAVEAMTKGGILCRLHPELSFSASCWPLRR